MQQVFLQHRNVRPHINMQMTAEIHSPDFTILDHTPYIPDLALSDFHHFLNLKERLRTHVLSDEEVKRAVKMWFCR
jgi:hypothetical protein